MTAYEEIQKMNQYANAYKKAMTKEMMQNTAKWQQVKAENAELLEAVKYPQALITALSAPYARKMMETN